MTAPPVGGEDFDGRVQGRLGQRVGIHAQVERAADALLLAQLADRLADGQDVLLVEAALPAEVPRCPDVPKATRWAGFSGSGWWV
jgi:hypothetical protein